jgi:hypothetical protein
MMPNRKHNTANWQIDALHTSRARLAHRGNISTIKRNCKRQRRVVKNFDNYRPTKISNSIYALHSVTARHFDSRLNNRHTRNLALTNRRLTRRSIPPIVGGDKPSQTLFAIHKHIAPCVYAAKPRTAAHTNCAHQ